MKTNVIETALPLVYCREGEFEVLNGLDLSRKGELWGIQLLSGVMVALKCGAGNNVPSTTRKNIEELAEMMCFKGQTGFLPSRIVLIEHWDAGVGEAQGMEEAKFEATVAVLKENQIEADGYRGYIWCCEDEDPKTGNCFSLKYGECVDRHKGCTNSYDRVALAFD